MTVIAAAGTKKGNALRVSLPWFQASLAVPSRTTPDSAVPSRAVPALHCSALLRPAELISRASFASPCPSHPRGMQIKRREGFNPQPSPAGSLATAVDTEMCSGCRNARVTPK
jgi:hypothetical protein